MMGKEMLSKQEKQVLDSSDHLLGDPVFGFFEIWQLTSELVYTNQDDFCVSRQKHRPRSIFSLIGVG
jgi:hypothetical protein